MAVVADKLQTRQQQLLTKMLAKLVVQVRLKQAAGAEVFRWQGQPRLLTRLAQVETDTTEAHSSAARPHLLRQAAEEEVQPLEALEAIVRQTATQAKLQAQETQQQPTQVQAAEALAETLQVVPAVAA